MESYGNVFDEECVNLSSMFFYDQDYNHVTGHELMFFNEHYDHGNLNLDHETPVLLPSANESNQSISSSSCTIDDQINLAYASDHDIRSNICNYFSQESGNIMEGDGSNFMFLAQVFSDGVILQDEVVDQKGKMGNSVSLKRKYEVLELPIAFEEGDTAITDKKKTRVTSDHHKNKKNSPPKKMQKMMTSVNRNDDDSELNLLTRRKNEKTTNKNNGRGNAQSLSSCSSEDDSTIVTEKTRASRGAATDPQSIYARKRRERINERLRILQTLVPNGTKVDISTMLEEAVHYVKFLQLQINLLSSDDKWMYAPIAYNGVDMGLYKTL